MQSISSERDYDRLVPLRITIGNSRIRLSFGLQNTFIWVFHWLKTTVDPNSQTPSSHLHKDTNFSINTFRKVNNENENDISCLRVGSSPTLTVHRQPVSPANTVFSGNSLSHPTTTLQFLGRRKPRTSATHLTLRPASSQALPVHFHRPMSSHITGRAGLKSNFHPLTAKSSSLKQGVSY